jgi:hypothetical protein
VNAAAVCTGARQAPSASPVGCRLANWSGREFLDVVAALTWTPHLGPAALSGGSGTRKGGRVHRP